MYKNYAVVSLSQWFSGLAGLGAAALGFHNTINYNIKTEIRQKQIISSANIVETLHIVSRRHNLDTNIHLHSKILLIKTLRIIINMPKPEGRFAITHFRLLFDSPPTHYNITSLPRICQSIFRINTGIRDPDIMLLNRNKSDIRIYIYILYTICIYLCPAVV